VVETRADGTVQEVYVRNDEGAARSLATRMMVPADAESEKDCLESLETYGYYEEGDDRITLIATAD
jgi:hypothetical protein